MHFTDIIKLKSSRFYPKMSLCCRLAMMLEQQAGQAEKAGWSASREAGTEAGNSSSKESRSGVFLLVTQLLF